MYFCSLKEAWGSDSKENIYDHDYLFESDEEYKLLLQNILDKESIFDILILKYKSFVNYISLHSNVSLLLVLVLLIVMLSSRHG